WFNVYNAVTGGREGLYCYDPATGKIINYRYRQNDSTSLSNNDVTYICEDHSGDMWIGTNRGGICRLDRHSQTFTRFPFIINDQTILDSSGTLDDGQVEY